MKKTTILTTIITIFVVGLGWGNCQLKAEAITVAHSFYRTYQTFAIMGEIWKDIDGYEGLYQISITGKIKSLDRILISKNNRVSHIKGKVLKQSPNFEGYKQVYLRNNDGKKNYYAHRLIAKTFIYNPESKPCVNHINGIKTDNIVGNLEWVTHSENLKHAHRIGIKKTTKYWKGKHGYDNASSKEIVREDLKGNELDRFGSILEASRLLDINLYAIRKSLKHNYTTKIGVFKYA